MKKHGCLWWFFIGWWWELITKRIRAQAEPPRSKNPVNPSQSSETHKVAGTSFRQDAIRGMGVKNPDFAKTKQALQDAGLTDKWVYEYEFTPDKVELLPEPDNPADPKAVKVVVDGTHIGYIKAGSCAHIHKLLAADRIQCITCFIGGGKCKRLFWDEDDRRYVLDRDETPFYARLSITVAPAD